MKSKLSNRKDLTKPACSRAFDLDWYRPSQYACGMMSDARFFPHSFDSFGSLARLPPPFPRLSGVRLLATNPVDLEPDERDKATLRRSQTGPLACSRWPPRWLGLQGRIVGWWIVSVVVRRRWVTWTRHRAARGFCKDHISVDIA